MKIVKYSADWCGPCVPYGKVFDAAVEDLGLSKDQVFRTDIADKENPHYDSTIMSVPVTRIFDDSGKIVEEKFGPMSKMALKKWIKAAEDKIVNN